MKTVLSIALMPLAISCGGHDTHECQYPYPDNCPSGEIVCYTKDDGSEDCECADGYYEQCDRMGCMCVCSGREVCGNNGCQCMPDDDDY